MKDLTKVLMILFVALIYNQTNAQTFVIKGGCNLTSILREDNNAKYINNYKINTGFNFGLTASIPFNEFFSFESGLLLTTKGSNDELEKTNGFKFNKKLDTYYLDIPLLLKVYPNLGDKLKLYGTVGPYIGVGLFGKTNTTVVFLGNMETEVIEKVIEWGNDQIQHDLKRLDIGLTFGTGIDIDPFLVEISYDMGLSNISAYQDDGRTLKNRVFKISIGYKL